MRALHWTVWLAWLALALGGLAAWPAGGPFLAAGIVGLVVSSLVTTPGARSLRLVAALAGLALAAAAWAWPDAGAPLLVLAAQAAIVAVGFDEDREKGLVRRFGVPFVAHAAATAGAVVAALGGGAALAVVLAASGLALALLHAQWARRPAGWEPVFLGALVVGLVATAALYAAEAGFLPFAVSRAAALGATAAALLVAFAIVAGAPPAPRVLRARSGVVLDTLAHGAAGIGILNVLFLGVSFVSGWSLKLVFGVLLAWQLLVFAMEYRTLRHVRRRKPGTLDALLVEPVTVIVPAANEAHVLEDTLAHNLAVEYPLRFVLVPATKSTDGTVEVARRFAQRHPDRVRVVLGDTGSKAEDLNKAWRDVDTAAVLLLDADETIDAGSVRRAVRVLQTHPDVGVVQGRKVSRAPEDGWLARFISAERRYSTWMDHVMHGEELGSGHFGGSAALVRAEVPPAIGGWTDATMTEDIEFTLRVHLDGRWRIVYDPDMVVREADPQDFAQLLRQRTRWARGWAQNFALYFPEVVEKRRALGRKRAFGLTLLLLISVSALWTTFVPASLLMRFAGISPLLPILVAIPMSLVLLPTRLLMYGYAAYRDPVIPLPRGAKGFAQLAGQAYLWILLGWFIQLHALYLELAAAPRTWDVTGKRRIAQPRPATPARA